MIDLSQQGYTHQKVIQLLSTFPRKERYYVNVWRNGGLVRSFFPIRCSLECNYYSAVKYSAAMTVLEMPDLNWRTDLLQPVMEIHTGKEKLEFSFCPFRVSTASKKISPGRTEWDLKLFDESYVLSNSSIGTRLVIRAGTKYTDAVSELLSRAGFSNVEIYPSDRIIPYDRDDWEESAAVLTVANQLLSELNYRSLEATADGLIRAYPYEVPSLKLANIHYSVKGQSVLLPDKKIEYDTNTKYNRFIGYASNPESADPIRFEYVNLDPENPLSVPAQGYTVTAPPRHFENVVEEAALAAAVMQWADETGDVYEKIEMETKIMPHHEVREIISLDSPAIDGIFVETAWKISDLSPKGTMSHSLREVY